MLGYIEGRPYVPPTHYDEREWLAFRSIFIKIYKAKQVTLGECERVHVTRLRVALKSCSKFRITKGVASCYVPEYANEELLPNRWEVSLRAVPVIGMHGLGVGIYSWWGEADKIITLASPQKDVRFLLNL